ncbi:mechanosensitive ion channel family protein [Oryzifoliimicrobium ureilyticus]|uniref:mechanosensitive ion channel family protein n=1 Tax=Oryzifoliimicrobium ureilyticus TaxID=3113724 RepID=UPI003F672CE2
MRSTSVFRHLLFAVVLCSTFVVCLGHEATAQADQNQQPQAGQQAQQQAPADGQLSQISGDLEKSKKQFESLKASVDANGSNDDALVDLAAKADELSRNVAALTGALNGRLEQVKTRLSAIGDPPKDGQPPEPKLVSDERNSLTSVRSQIGALQGDAESLSGAVGRLSNQIIETRRRLFTETLFRQTDVSLQVLDDARSAFRDEARDFGTALISWFHFVWKFKRVALFAALAFSLGVGAVILVGGYRLFGRYLQQQDRQERPSYMTRLSVAFWSTIVRAASIGAFLTTSYFFLYNLNVLRPDISPVIAALFGCIGAVYFVNRFTNAVFAPYKPQWRLVRLSNRGARTISFCLVSLAAVTAVDFFLSSISEAMGSPLVLTVIRSLFASLIVGGTLFAVSFGRPMLARDRNPDSPGRHWPKGLRIALRILGIVLIGAVLTGYVGLARFISVQLIITGALVVTMYIGILSGRAISQTGVFADTFLGEFVTRRYNLGPVVVDQIGLLVGLLIYAVALMTGIPLILLMWGFHIQDLEIFAIKLFTEVKVGGINFSLLGLLTGILVFAAGYFATRWIQRWLDNNIMARSHADLGVRNSVKTGIGYLGIGIVTIIAVSAAGINLSSFALVASALSVGIGFGLQNIVSNFVSGLILLVERPFKVGDHVISGTAEGIVTRISVRATEIETFRKQSIIVPNSDLINGMVGNWTHRNKVGRSEIPVSVSYDSDPQKVMDILLELVRDIPQVLRNPEPHVEFLRFGAYSLDFELRFMLADMGEGLKVRNNLRIAILKRFKEEDIKMPIPQSEVHFDGPAEPPLPKAAPSDPAKA